MQTAIRQVAGALCIAVAAAFPAEAADFRLTGFFSVDADARTRSGRENDSDPNRLSGSTNLGVTARWRTPTSQIILSPGVRLTGRTIDDLDGTDTDVNFRFSGSLVDSQPRLTTRANLQVVPQFRSARRFDELFIPFDPEDPDAPPEEGVTTVVSRDVDPLEININGDVAFSYRADPRNSFTLRPFFRVREYDENVDNLPATRTFGTSLGWNNQINERLSGGLSGAFQYFSSEDSGDDSQTFSIAGTFGNRLTSRHRLNGSLGVTVVNDDDGLEPRANGSLNFNYALARTSISTGGVLRVQQRDDGSIDNVARLRGAIRHQINSVSSVAAAASLEYALPIDNASDADEVTFRFSPTYSHRFAERWSLSAGYGFEIRNEGDTEIVNRVFIGLSRAITF